jgi:hypothetical protein
MEVDLPRIFRELLQSQIHRVGLYAVVAAGAGLLLGMLLGTTLYFLTKLAGAFRLGGTRERWGRIAAAVFTAGGCAALGSLMGCWEGSLRGYERVVSESQLRTEGLRRVSEAVAVGLYLTDMSLQERTPAEKEFLEGRCDFDPVGLLNRLDRAEREAIRRRLPELTEAVRKKVPMPESALLDALMGKLFEAVILRAVHAEIGGRLKDFGADIDRFLRTLPEAARPGGDPARLSFEEARIHFEETVLIPVLLTPARAFVRSQQLALAAGMMVVWLIPVVAVAVARRMAPQTTTL